MTMRAFALSEKYEVPVVLRPCLRVCHARQNVRLGEIPAPADVGPFTKNWTRWAAIPKYRLVLHKELNEKLEIIRAEEPESKPRPIVEGSGKGLAVITSGSVSSHVRDVLASDHRLKDIDAYKVDLPFPADWRAMQQIVDTHDKTLVIEETYPVLELQLNDRRRVQGRVSGFVPSQGELVPELVEDLIVQAMGLSTTPRKPPQIKPRRPTLCAGCPHRPAFYMIKKVFGKAVYTGDIGCYTLGINMGAVDTCLCMGASLGMAGGFVRGRGPASSGADIVPAESPPHRATVVATIGDSTFYHAGVAALINAVHTNAQFVLVIMDNSVSAMTGGQPTPAGSHLADGSPAKPVDMERLIRGCGADFLEVVDPYDHDALEESLLRARVFTYEQSSGPSVVITRRPCVRMPGSQMPDERFVVTEACDHCMTCMRDLECPALNYIKEEKRMEIDPDVCSGCGFCAHVCPARAIEPGKD